ncbi:MAG: aminotransferase [Bacteroidales bacterium]|nr:aminotransferase [Bacteroidales bacterium]
MKTIDHIILYKKSYSKPKVTRVILDTSISLVMMTASPPNPPPRGGGSKGEEPFQSPFGDKPFS